MNPEEFASEIIDLASEFAMVQDYEIDLLENIVVKARIELEKGFIEVYRNFDTGKVAFAWISDRERIYGVDNTDGWHIHPLENPEEHKPCKPLNLKGFLQNVEKFFQDVEE